MDSYTIQSSTITIIPNSLTKSYLLDKNSLNSQVIRFPSFNKFPNARKIRTFEIKAQASGVARFSSSATEAIPKDTEVKDDDLVFVAGATGKVGSRTVRELLKLGFGVRAGVVNSESAQSLVQSVKQMKIDGEGAQPIDKLEIVECDFDKPNEIGSALGNASTIISSILASENGLLDITGPYRLDYQATKNLIDAATAAKVKHFLMVSSLGTNKFGFPVAILNLFGGFLIWKRKSEEALIASGIPYSILRTGCMEQPTDAFKETHNVIVSEEDTLFSGQVSNLQVAELLAFMAKNSELSYCKVVEVIAKTTAPLTPTDELLTKIHSQRPIPKVPSAAETQEPAILKTVATEQPKAVAPTPQSLYTAYPDLKPPTSPAPIPSGNQKQSSSYINATSMPGIVNSQLISLEVLSGIPETEPVPTKTRKPTPLSPYTAYADLKPPTSPSPLTPAGLTLTSSTTEVLPKVGRNGFPSAASDEQEHANSKPRSLSPYTMYEDMKPPTSPIPSGN